MATRKLVLGSTAILLLSGATISAAPVSAQSSDPAQAYSAAKAQYDSELRDHTPRQQAYERQRSEYNAKIDDYQRSLNAPLPARMPDVVVVGEPDRDVVVLDQDGDTTVVIDKEPGDRTVVVKDPHEVVIDDFAQRLLIRNVPPLMRVEDVADPDYELFNMPVLDSTGSPVGHSAASRPKVPAT